MSSVITILFILTRAFSPSIDVVTNDASMGYTLPEMVITAEPLTNYEALAPYGTYYDATYGWMLPTMVISASRYEPSVWSTIAELILPRMAYAQENVQFKVLGRPVELNVTRDSAHAVNMTMGGNYTLAAGDTVRDDVSVSGGTANINGVIIGDLAVMGGEAFATGTVDGDAAVMGGNLFITGTVTGDAAVFGGKLRHQGTIEGDIFVVGGEIELDSGSVVKGDIGLVGGNISRDSTAVVLGEVKSVGSEKLRQFMPRIFKAWRLSPHVPGAGAIPFIFLIAAMIVIYLLNLLILAIFHKGIEQVNQRIQTKIWLSAALGVGVIIMFVPALLLFAISIIGIPLIPALILAVAVAMMFGITSLSCVVGEKIGQGLNMKVSGKVGLFTLGWLALNLIPFFGFILVGKAGILGALVFILGLTIGFVVKIIALGSVILALFHKNIEG